VPSGILVWAAPYYDAFFGYNKPTTGRLAAQVSRLEAHSD
jgi:hypothetical protein